jgi:hypothetical protein
VTESIGLGPSPRQPIVDMCSVCVVEEEEDPWKKSSAGAGRSIIGHRPKALARVRWKARLRAFPGLQDSTCTRDSS